MQFLRRYWVALLVLLLVSIHAAIIGYVRTEAKRVKVTASTEIPVGVYYIPSADGQWLKQLRIHVLVKPDLRLSAKSTIEMHRWLVHEAVEERLRQVDPALLSDPVLLEVKAQVKSVLEDALREAMIEQVVINDRVDFPIHEFRPKPGYDIATEEPIYAGKPVFQPHAPTEEVEGGAGDSMHQDAENTQGGHGESGHASAESEHAEDGHAAEHADHAAEDSHHSPQANVHH